MNTTTPPRRAVPDAVRSLPLGQRIRWARTSARLSHDRLVDTIGRSNRGHLIKIEKGLVQAPGFELRDAIADATNVPRELFADDEEDEADQVLEMFEVLLSRLAQHRKKKARPAHLSGERGTGHNPKEDSHDGGTNARR